MSTLYKFNGKEKDEETGMYYYGARYYIPELSIWGSVDPLSDKYPSMSPFMYCAGNPVVLVDPNGMDIWDFDENGNYSGRTINKKYDQLRVVSINADGDKNIISETDKFKYGTVKHQQVIINENSKVDFLGIIGDDNAKKTFELFANNTNVEWTHAKVGKKEGIYGSNVVGTNHNESSTAVGAFLRTTGLFLREVNHNHPSGSPLPSWDQTNGIWNSKKGDVPAAYFYEKINPKIKLNIYTKKYGYSPYDSKGTLDERILNNKIR